MNAILEFLALLSTIVGTSALYIFVIKSFARTGDQQQKRPVELQKIIQQKTFYFIISLIMSEFLGIFFLLLTGSVKHSIITFNGFAFLVASCLWSIVTIVNAIRSNKVNLYIRFLVQFATLFFALLFIRISIEIPDARALEQIAGRISLFLQFFSVFYFGTSVIAVILILWETVKLEIEFMRIYLLWVLLIGITVGTGLYFISNNWQKLLLTELGNLFSPLKILAPYVG